MTTTEFLVYISSPSSCRWSRSLSQRLWLRVWDRVSREGSCRIPWQAARRTQRGQFSQEYASRCQVSNFCNFVICKLLNYSIWFIVYSAANSLCFYTSYPQANLQGVHRPTDSGSLTSRKLTAGAYFGAWDPRLPDPLQPYHSRVWIAGHLCSHDLSAELPERGSQTSGQDVS